LIPLLEQIVDLFSIFGFKESITKVSGLLLDEEWMTFFLYLGDNNVIIYVKG
jgi:hypothetical protein